MAAGGGDSPAVHVTPELLPTTTPSSALARVAGFCDSRVLRKSLQKLPKDPATCAAALHEALFTVARRCEEPSMMEDLVAHGADLAARDGLQRTPLHAAVSGNVPPPGYAVPLRGGRGAEMVRWLLEARSEPAVGDERGWTPLHIAAFAGDTASARLLLEWRAHPGARSTAGETPLQAIESTCWQGRGAQSMCAQHSGVVKVLMSAGPT
mmetsp:Transcript_25216/g.72704  ORF Transcript_25216/g.72704 Transcript_25216/m.72704 type:complete len:209 (-) Transcript_25216:44-670(-)